jgi:hypothetical protein
MFGNSNSDRTASSELVLNYVAGIGASAGGLEALEQMFQNMPGDTGMAFVVIQHLSPDFDSMMAELLVRKTDMPVQTATDGMAVKPNGIYLIPPKKEMIISDGKLLLKDKDPEQGLSLPIDQFSKSLARDFGERSVGIVLSGTGSDGSRGICDIHEAGGLVIVQTQDTAKFDGMPKITGFCQRRDSQRIEHDPCVARADRTLFHAYRKRLSNLQGIEADARVRGTKRCQGRTVYAAEPDQLSKSPDLLATRDSKEGHFVISFRLANSGHIDAWAERRGWRVGGRIQAN